MTRRPPRSTRTDPLVPDTPLFRSVQSLDEAAAHLRQVDGVMIGRAAYQSPYALAEADRLIFGEAAEPKSREQVIADFLPYVERQLAEGVPLKSITKHLLGLFNGLPGALPWRPPPPHPAPRPQARPAVPA